MASSLQLDPTPFIVNDVKVVQLDKEKLSVKKCTLLNETYLYIKKEKFGERYYFMAYQDEGLTKQVGEANCAKSELGMVNIKAGARKCGIGTLLTYLCMVDRDVNPVNGSTYINIKKEFKGDANMIRFAQRCSGLFKVLMQADKYGGNAYFYAADAANYKMVLVFVSNKNKLGIKSKHGQIYDLDVARNAYNNDNFEHTYWYFCKT